MLYHDRTDISEAIDVAKSNNSKKCLVSHYSNIFAWVFFYILFGMVVMI